MYNTKQLEKDLGQFDIVLDDRQLAQLITYYEMLTEQNKVMNLTAITEYEEVMKKHFVDSLSLVKVCRPLRGMTLIDVGTGAGFPGLPLKIVFPDLKVTLLDSLKKRVSFLEKVIDALKLTDVKAIHGRAEDHASLALFRESYDVCVSRAVANLTTLSEYCLPFVKVGGLFVSYKSEKITEEAAKAKKAIAVLGGTVQGQEEFLLPDSDIYRNLFVIKKTGPTPKKYPRRAGLPAKEPLQ